MKHNYLLDSNAVMTIEKQDLRDSSPKALQLLLELLKNLLELKGAEAPTKKYFKMAFFKRLEKYTKIVKFTILW